MKGAAGLWLVLAACGRIGFDPHGPASTDDASDGDTTDAPAIPAGLVLWLQMETDPTAGIVDSARGHVVQCGSTGCPTRVPSLDGTGYQFNGQFLTVPYLADLDPSAGYTISTRLMLMMYPASGYSCLISKPIGGTDFDTYSLCVADGTSNPANGILFYSYSAANGEKYLYAESYPGLPCWHLLTMSWDGSMMRGYVEGQRMVGPTAVKDDSGASALIIGADSNSGNPTYFSTAILDDVRIYDHALSDAEVALLPSAGDFDVCGN